MTALAPTVCPTCKGTRLVPAPDRWDGTPMVDDCPDCCCSTCGEPTSTPPLCADCDQKEHASGS